MTSLALPLASLGLFGTNNRALAMASLGTIYIVSVETYVTDTDAYSVISYAPSGSVVATETGYRVSSSEVRYMVIPSADINAVSVEQVGTFVQMRDIESFATMDKVNYGVIPLEDRSTVTVDRS